MKTYKLFPILFFAVFCSKNTVAQQSVSNTEGNSTQVTVHRTANPDYKAEQVNTGKVTSERTKNPNAEKETNAGKHESESVITNEKTKNPGL